MPIAIYGAASSTPTPRPGVSTSDTSMMNFITQSTNILKTLSESGPSGKPIAQQRLAVLIKMIETTKKTMR